MGSRLVAPLAAVAVAAAGLVACSGGDDPTLRPPESPAEGAAPSATTGPGGVSDTATTEAAASRLWNGTAATVSGEHVDLASYVGRDVAVWFWAPW